MYFRCSGGPKEGARRDEPPGPPLHPHPGHLQGAARQGRGGDALQDGRGRAHLLAQS